MDNKCSIEGCNNKRVAKGFCDKHYNRMRKGLDMQAESLTWKWKPNDPRYRNKNVTCKIEGCNGKYYAKGYCHTHYADFLRNGTSVYKPIEPIRPCIVNGCKELAKSSKSFLCKFHYQRFRDGVELERPKGVKGELNPRWNGGTSQYKDHYTMKKIRKEVLKEANYICAFCGERKATEVHHKDLSKDNHSKENLVPCCHKCHCRQPQKPRKPSSTKYRRKYGLTLKEMKEQYGSVSAFKELYENSEMYAFYN